MRHLGAWLSLSVASACVPGAGVPAATGDVAHKHTPGARGQIRVMFGQRGVAARGISVWLERRDAEGRTAAVKTDAHGDWLLADRALAAGTWVVCSGAPGLPDACDERTFELAPGGQRVAPRHVRTAPAGTLGGRITLAGGAACHWRFPVHGVAVDTEVGVEGDARGRVRANAEGEFLIFGAKPAAMVATCEASTLRLDVAPDRWVDASFANSPPSIHGLVARSDGEAVTVRAMDVALSVSLVADDPDRDPLTARWASSGGPVAGERVEGAPGLVLQWTPTATAADLEVLVGDGRGGYDLEPLRLPESAPAPPSGPIRGPGDAVVANATLAQGATRVAADATGAFALPAWDATSPLVVSAPGFVDRVVTADRAPSRFPLQLVPCERVALDADAGGTVSLPSAPAALSVTVPAGAIVDDHGEPVHGPVDLCLAVLGGDDYPLGGLVRDGARVLPPTRAAWVDVLRGDGGGGRLAFAPDRAATVSMALTGDELGAMGPEHHRWSYSGGHWEDAGASSIRGDRAVALLQAPGAVTPAAVDDEFGCVRLWLGGLTHQANYALRWRVVGSPLASATVVPITEGLDILTPLPARRDIRVELVDVSRPGHPPVTHMTRVVNSGSTSLQPSSALRVRYPYDLCGADLVIAEPVARVAFLSRYQLRDGTASDGQTVTAQQLAEAYYRTVDPDDARTTLRRWWQINGIWESDTGFFIADAETVTARKSEPGVAREFAVKYGVHYAPDVLSAHLGLFPDMQSAVTFADRDNSSVPLVPPRTLAIEHRPATASEPARVTFFAFVGGARVTAIDLDGRGLELVPMVCMNCHGGDHLDADALAESVRQTGKWPSPNVGARLIPFALDTLEFVTIPGQVMQSRYGRVTADRHLRAFNAQLLAREALTASARAFVHGVYGSGDPSATTLPANPYDESWFPPGAGAAGWGDDPLLYRDVVAPYCRSCHLQVFPEFGSREDFRALADLIEEDVCWHRSMPHSAVVSAAFWGSTPYAPGSLESGMAGAPGWRGLGCAQP